MLRSLDEKGGVGVYTRNILSELLKLDRKNHYLLLYRNPANLGLYAGYRNVKEVVVPGANKAYWDQVAVPLICWKEKIDIIFHPKFTVPFFAPCKTVMVVHGADWLIPEQAQFYSPRDVRYMRLVLPMYFRKASKVISVSQETTDNFLRLLNLSKEKIQTIYFAPARQFRQITDLDELNRVRVRYKLPERFILTLTKRKGDSRKNLGQVFKAYELYHTNSEAPYKLVIGGQDCHLFRQEYGIPDDGYGADILFPGWIDQEDMPAVFSLAGIYLYPSNLEAFPIPLTEAMACGTPIITSSVNGLKEIAGDAAIFVNPSDTSSIVDSISRLLSDPDLRTNLSRKGFERSTMFSWDLCAQNTLSLLEQIGAS